jgi:RNA-directed DNA polymerase
MERRAERLAGRKGRAEQAIGHFIEPMACLAVAEVPAGSEWEYELKFDGYRAIAHITEGFDFLGQHVRRYPNGKLFIKPARKSIRSLLVRVKEIIREHDGSTAHLLIVRLNPVIRGWASYHRHVVSKRIFARVDATIFRMLWKWARARHPRKPRRWIKRKYFERVGTRDWWFFGESADKEPRFQHLRLFHAAAVRIVRHVLVKSDVNPYDPRWAKYLEQRSSRRSTLSASTPWAFGSA